MKYVRYGGLGNRLAMFVETRNLDEIVAFALFRGSDDGAIRLWLEADPLVRSSALQPATYKQWLAAGALGK